MLLDSQYWPEADLQAYQRSQLRQLLLHARAHVPFYRNRLDAVIRPDGEIDWDRWSEIPIVKRSNLSERGEEMLADALPAGHGGTTWSMTSGSSGTAVKVLSSGRANLALRANRFRSYRWHKVDWGRVSCRVFGEDPADAAWPAGKVLGSWGPPWEPAERKGALIEINRLTAYDKIVEFIERKRPGYLSTGPKTAVAVALEAERLGAGIQIDALLSQGAMTGDLEHETMRRVFGARVVALYSSKECGQIAHGCPDQSGMHVNAESVLVELLDDDGMPCAAGQSGRVVITPLFNAAQPLIRYDQGDRAEWMGPCPCGRHLPRLSVVIGRATALFYHPDGRARAGILHYSDRAILDCRDWQVAQTGPHDFEIRYIPRDWNVRGDEDAMAERLREVYFDDARVSFRRVSDLPSRNGKTVEYTNEWLPPGRA